MGKLSALSLISITMFLVLNKVNSADTISFTFDKFRPSSLYLTLQGEIWYNATGKVANFQTLFSFVINQTLPRPADGFAFFMAPINTTQARGGVEFDTFHNRFHPPQVRYIGINVNNIRYIQTRPFRLDNGKVAHVVIIYDASSKILQASLTQPSPESGTVYTITVQI
ncbi:hypothetical protein VNO78_21536 [Psophocarpus tetragonolobus]|uniref:Legume lectin domain-containing protein n=1 Tax=Psophocarpus tetragonolobus TaxID=3891 RepID=A0AAN9XI76_PSOTE